jgi:hypothetical protein
MKNSNDIIGNRNSDLLVCSAVPQPTAPPRVAMNVWILTHVRRHEYFLYIAFSLVLANRPTFDAVWERCCINELNKQNNVAVALDAIFRPKLLPSLFTAARPSVQIFT